MLETMYKISAEKYFLYVKYRMEVAIRLSLEKNNYAYTNGKKVMLNISVIDSNTRYTTVTLDLAQQISDSDLSTLMSIFGKANVPCGNGCRRSTNWTSIPGFEVFIWKW